MLAQLHSHNSSKYNNSVRFDSVPMSSKKPHDGHRPCRRPLDSVLSCFIEMRAAESHGQQHEGPCRAAECWPQNAVNGPGRMFWIGARSP